MLLCTGRHRVGLLKRLFLNRGHAKSHERAKLEHFCLYIARPAVAERGACQERSAVTVSGICSGSRAMMAPLPRRLNLFMLGSGPIGWLGIGRRRIVQGRVTEEPARCLAQESCCDTARRHGCQHVKPGPGSVFGYDPAKPPVCSNDDSFYLPFPITHHHGSA